MAFKESLPNLRGEVAGNCHVYGELFDNYCSNQLSSAEKEKFAGHLEECSFCAMEVKSYERTMAIVNSAKAPSFDDDFWNSQKKRICAAACSRASLVVASEQWRAPRFSLIFVVTFIAAYIIDGIGQLYISSSYLSNVMSLIAESFSGRFFDVSFLVYLGLATIGVASFLSEPSVKPVTVRQKT